MDLLAAADRIGAGEMPVYFDGAGVFKGPPEWVIKYKAAMDEIFYRMGDAGFMGGAWEREMSAFMASRKKEAEKLAMAGGWPLVIGVSADSPPLGGLGPLVVSLGGWADGAGIDPGEAAALLCEWQGRYENNGDWSPGRIKTTVVVWGAGTEWERRGYYHACGYEEDKISAASGKVMSFRSAGSLAAWADCIRVRAEKEEAHVKAMTGQKREAWVAKKTGSLLAYAEKFPSVSAGAGARISRWEDMLTA